MSDYVQTVFFGPKDALTTGDPNKRVKGTEMDVELDAIGDAIVTKYDSTDLASQAQARAGTSNVVLMTPLRAADAAVNGSFAGARQCKVKTGDTIRISTSTLAADPHLAGFVLQAGKRYTMRAVLRIAAAATPGIKMSLNFSEITNNVNAVGVFAPFIDSALTVYSSGSSTWIGVSTITGQTSGTQGITTIECIFRANTITGGTVDFQWAQNVSDASGTTIQENSYIELIQLD